MAKAKEKKTEATVAEIIKETELEQLLKKPFDAKDICKGGDMYYTTKTGDEITKLNKEIILKICPAATEVEILMFMRFCRQYGLDPYLQEVYLVNFKKGQPAQIVIAAQTYLQNADKDRNYDGFNCGWIVSEGGKGRTPVGQGGAIGPDEEIIGAWCHVFRKDRKTAPQEVLISEAIRKKLDYETKAQVPMATWKTQPYTMTMKCARGQAHRFAFPNMFGNTISSDEADYVQNQQTWEPVDNATVPKRDDRTGDDKKDVTMNRSIDKECKLLADEFTELLGTDDAAVCDKLFEDFIPYVITEGYKPDEELTLDQIDALRNHLKEYGLPKAVKDMIPEPKPLPTAEEMKGILNEKELEAEKPQSEIDTAMDADPKTLFKNGKNE